MLIFVFDPLAVWLTLATNKVLVYHAGGIQKHKPLVIEEEFAPQRNKYVPLPSNKNTENSDNTPAHSLRKKK